MTIGRFIFILCDCCDEEFGPEMTESMVRREAKKSGWQVGVNRIEPDFCPAHRDALKPKQQMMDSGFIK